MKPTMVRLWLDLFFLLCMISAGYVYWVHQFRKEWRVQINGYRISPWVCSAVYLIWIFGMAALNGIGFSVVSALDRPVP
jgi:hypothetical protein